MEILVMLTDLFHIDFLGGMCHWVTLHFHSYEVSRKHSVYSFYIEVCMVEMCMCYSNYIVVMPFCPEGLKMVWFNWFIYFNIFFKAKWYNCNVIYIWVMPLWISCLQFNVFKYNWEKSYILGASEPK